MHSEEHSVLIQLADFTICLVRCHLGWRRQRAPVLPLTSSYRPHCTTLQSCPCLTVLFFLWVVTLVRVLNRNNKNRMENLFRALETEKSHDALFRSWRTREVGNMSNLSGKASEKDRMMVCSYSKTKGLRTQGIAGTNPRGQRPKNLELECPRTGENGCPNPRKEKIQTHLYSVFFFLSEPSEIGWFWRKLFIGAFVMQPTSANAKSLPKTTSKI